jgi:hypothetical protein
VTRRFKPPVYARSGRGSNGATRWVVNLGDDERAMIVRLLGDLRAMLNEDAADPDARSEVLTRLFPTAYPDDVEKEAEYQRLMREDLVVSRVTQIDAVTEILDHDTALDEGQVIALMQSVNAIRVVLGTLLDVSDDDLDDDSIGPDDPLEAERHLYGYLSWLLEWIVRSQQS